MSESIYVIATVKLQGIGRGRVRRVNPEAPWVKENISGGYLRVVDGPDATLADLAAAAIPEATDEEIAAVLPDAAASEEAEAEATEPEQDRLPDIETDEPPAEEEVEAEEAAAIPSG